MSFDVCRGGAIASALSMLAGKGERISRDEQNRRSSRKLQNRGLPEQSAPPRKPPFERKRANSVASSRARKRIVRFRGASAVFRGRALENARARTPQRAFPARGSSASAASARERKCNTRASRFRAHARRRRGLHQTRPNVCLAVSTRFFVHYLLRLPPRVHVGPAKRVLSKQH